MSKDIYNKHNHTKETTTISLERFYMDGIPVCISWYGDDKHPTEACVFLQFRKLGLVPVCAYLGKDTNDEPDTINRVLDECPLHNIQKTNDC